MSEARQKAYEAPDENGSFIIADHPQALRLIASGLLDRVRAYMADEEHKAEFEKWKKQSVENGNPYGLKI